VITFGPGRPGTLACRQAARNRSITPVLTPAISIRSAASQRQNASRSNPYERTVRGE
jgi:hypothetical protein